MTVLNELIQAGTNKIREVIAPRNREPLRGVAIAIATGKKVDDDTLAEVLEGLAPDILPALVKVRQDRGAAVDELKSLGTLQSEAKAATAEHRKLRDELIQKHSEVTAILATMQAHVDKAGTKQSFLQGECARKRANATNLLRRTADRRIDERIRELSGQANHLQSRIGAARPDTGLREQAQNAVLAMPQQIEQFKAESTPTTIARAAEMSARLLEARNTLREMDKRDKVIAKAEKEIAGLQRQMSDAEAELFVADNFDIPELNRASN